MKVRFFHVDSDTVQQADQSRLLAAWQRRKPWNQSTGKHDLKLITVVCDDGLHPVHIYLLKLSLEDGLDHQGVTPRERGTYKCRRTVGRRKQEAGRLKVIVPRSLEKEETHMM